MANTEKSISPVGRRELILRTAGLFSLIGLGGSVTREARADTETLVLTPQEEQGGAFRNGASCTFRQPYYRRPRYRQP